MFDLFYGLSVREDEGDLLDTLHSWCRSHSPTSPIVERYGDECHHLSDEDHYEIFRCHAAFGFTHGTSLVIATPETMRGFAVKLNNERVLCLGLCRMPESFELRDGRVESPWNGRLVWHAGCRTVVPQKDFDTCLAAHVAALGILDEAEQMGFRVRIDDRTRFWNSKNAETLEAAWTVAKCGVERVPSLHEIAASDWETGPSKD